jgi:LPS sulfotransferase NodH
VAKKSKGGQASPATATAGAARPITSWGDVRLDYAHTVPLRRSYIVASSYRCGSTFLCTELWKTGVLGAPTEYVNMDKGFAAIPTPTEPGRLMLRLGAKTPEEYFVKLLERRTGRNGIFGMKARSHPFEPVTGKNVRDDADFIAHCMDEVEQQGNGWWRCFAANAVAPPRPPRSSSPPRPRGSSGNSRPSAIAHRA